jgi:cytochrome c oxidase subunit 2
MKAHTYEKTFLAVGGVTLVACMGALVYATFGMGKHLPGISGHVDPQRAYQSPPFDRLGVTQVGPNRYEAILVGQMFAFIPPEIRVPVGAQIDFIATSADVIHGFNIEGTRVNMMLIPGQIGRISHTFAETGEHLLICHEYCGSGHHTMAGRIIVEGSAGAPREGAGQ